MIENLKEGGVYHACYDAIAIEETEQAFTYILENLPPNAPEKKMIKEIMQEHSIPLERGK